MKVSLEKNSIMKYNERVSGGKNEIKDFVYIQKELERISITVETLQLWVEQMLADEKINIKKYNQIKGE